MVKEMEMVGDADVSTKGHNASKWMILSAVMMGVIMGPIDGSIVNVVLPSIAMSFQTDYSLAQWVPTIYLLAVCSFILVYGRLGDMLGYKKIFLTGLACFAVASLLCGLSRNIWMLIIFRAIQGLTVAMQMALGMAIVTAAFPPKERGKAIGIYATAIALGLMIGPVLGGIIAQYLSWRFVFFHQRAHRRYCSGMGLPDYPSGERKPRTASRFFRCTIGIYISFQPPAVCKPGKKLGLVFSLEYRFAAVHPAVRMAVYPYRAKIRPTDVESFDIFKPSLQLCLPKLDVELHGPLYRRLPDALVPCRRVAAQRVHCGHGHDVLRAPYFFRWTIEREPFRPHRIARPCFFRDVYSCGGIGSSQRFRRCLRQSGCGLAPSCLRPWRRNVPKPDQ